MQFIINNNKTWNRNAENIVGNLVMYRKHHRPLQGWQQNPLKVMWLIWHYS